MTGVGLPVTSHTKLIGWFRTTETLPGVSPSRKSGGTVEAVKCDYYMITALIKIKRHVGKRGHELVVTVDFELIFPLSGSSVIDSSTDVLSIIQR